MAQYIASVRTARLQEVLDRIDAGVAAGGARMKIYTTGRGTLLANCEMDEPAGSVTGDVLTFTTPFGDTSADNSGTPAIADIEDSDGVTVVSGLTVGTSGTDVIVSSGTITGGVPFDITSATITHPT